MDFYYKEYKTKNKVMKYYSWDNWILKDKIYNNLFFNLIERIKNIK